MLDFNEHGLLPSGDHVMNFDLLKASILVKGNSKCDEEWDEEWRLQLADNLEILTKQLWEVGITEIFIDGSFATIKSHPNDIDGYFVCDVKKVASGELERDLNKINPHKIWTWDPKSLRTCRGSTKRQLPMWHKYRIELYPEYGQFFGVLDEHGHPLQFPAAFRKERYTRRPKGIIKILK